MYMCMGPLPDPPKDFFSLGPGACQRTPKRGVFAQRAFAGVFP